MGPNGTVPAFVLSGVIFHRTASFSFSELSPSPPSSPRSTTTKNGTVPLPVKLKLGGTFSSTLITPCGSQPKRTMTRSIYGKRLKASSQRKEDSINIRAEPPIVRLDYDLINILPKLTIE